MFNQYPTSTHCQHNIQAISCSICNNTQPQVYNQMETQIKNYEEQLKAYRDLVAAQDKKIIDLAMKLAYANQTIENLTVEKPQKEQEPQYLYVYNDERECKTWMSPELIRYTDGWVCLGKVRIERNRDEYNKKQREYRAKRKAIGNPITRKS